MFCERTRYNNCAKGHDTDAGKATKEGGAKEGGAKRVFVKEEASFQ